VLAVALLALVAALSSGALALRRASQTSTAAALANQQMELYRGLKYCSIRLDDASIPGSTPYTSDSAWSALQVLDTVVCGVPPNPTTCPAGPPNECDASRDVTGPDGRRYRVDTYIVPETPTGGRELKRVTVVVRNGDTPTVRGLSRTSSKFDQSTG
jgi:type II secretory pathway pseudopilin PulG